jgi:hypothetical protein
MSIKQHAMEGFAVRINVDKQPCMTGTNDPLHAHRLEVPGHDHQAAHERRQVPLLARPLLVHADARAGRQTQHSMHVLKPAGLRWAAAPQVRRHPATNSSLSYGALQRVAYRIGGKGVVPPITCTSARTRADASCRPDGVSCAYSSSQPGGRRCSRR